MALFKPDPYIRIALLSEVGQDDTVQLFIFETGRISPRGASRLLVLDRLPRHDCRDQLERTISTPSLLAVLYYIVSTSTTVAPLIEPVLVNPPLHFVTYTIL